MPSSWFPRTEQAAGVAVQARQEKKGHNSAYCLLLASPASKVVYGAYSQPINLPPDTKELLLSFYFRTKDFPQADVYVLLFGTDFAVREWNTPYMQSEDRAIPQARDWSLMAWRFPVLPGAVQALVAFRATGQGELYVDDVALRPYPQVIELQVVEPGLVARLPTQRTLELRGRVLASAGPLTASLQLFAAGQARTVWRQQLSPQAGESLLLKGTYALDYRRAATGLLLVSGPASDQVYDVQSVRVPALLDGRITSPAFRATRLRSVPCSAIEAEGVINATPELAERLRLSARLAGTDKTVAEGQGVQRASARTWRALFDCENLLTGSYRLEVTAAAAAASYTLGLPMLVAGPRDNEVGYDERGVTWVGGRPWLPRGIYYATTAAEMDKAKAAGFNFTVIPWALAATAVLEHAAAAGLRALVQSNSLERSFWTYATAKFGSHPALLGWHTIGKPDAKLELPSQLSTLYQQLAELDPHHPIMTTLTMPARMVDYAAGTDVVLVWTDPIPESGVKTVGLLVDEARRAAAPRPVWAVVQAVGHHWSWDKQLDAAAEGRPPTPAEHRAMTYLALVHGASGVLHYAYALDASERGKNYCLPRDAPALWTSIAATNRELAWIEPLLVRGHWHPVELAAEADVHLAYWLSDQALLAIAVNTTDRPTAAPLQLPPVRGAFLTEVLTGEKLLGTVEGSFGVQLEPYGVAVLAGRLK
jgi:hypothetical protein